MFAPKGQWRGLQNLGLKLGTSFYQNLVIQSVLLSSRRFLSSGLLLLLLLLMPILSFILSILDLFFPAAYKINKWLSNILYLPFSSITSVSLQAPSVLQVSTAPGGLQVPKGQEISVCVSITWRKALELRQEVQPTAKSLLTSSMWVFFRLGLFCSLLDLQEANIKSPGALPAQIALKSLLNRWVSTFIAFQYISGTLHNCPYILMFALGYLWHAHIKRKYFPRQQ